MYGDDDHNTVIGRMMNGGIADRYVDHPSALDRQRAAEKKAWDAVKAAINAVPRSDASTTSYFWDCECETHYIQAKDNRLCYGCDTALRDDPQPPDSRLREVLLMLIEEAGL